MSKSMRRFDTDLIQEGRRLIALAKAGEIVRFISGPGSPQWEQWPLSRLEALYELAFLRMFIAWETFLEDTFLRYMCGQTSRHGQAIPVVKHHGTIAAAEVALLAGQKYLAWYDPVKVIARCKNHISNGRHEIVFSANTPWLDHLGRIRHRIAHGQKNAKQQFDQATTALVGRVYPASRSGRFLRDWDTASTPRVRWLETLFAKIGNLAGQIV